MGSILVPAHEDADLTEFNIEDGHQDIHVPEGSVILHNGSPHVTQGSLNVVTSAGGRYDTNFGHVRDASDYTGQTEISLGE